MHKPIHIPDGLMCMGCTKALDKCNHLDFTTMRVIDKKDKNYPVVKCTEYIRSEKKE